MAMPSFPNYQFQVLDYKIHAVVAGKGPLILFIHGIGLSWEWWQPTLAALSDGFSVCAIDLPGSGSSSPWTSQPPQTFYKAFVARIIELLGLGPAIVVGHSLGGYITAQAAIQKAPGIKAIALVAPAGFGSVQNIYMRLLSIPILGEALMLPGHVGLPILLRSLVYDPRSVSEEMRHWADISPAAKRQFLYQLRRGVLCGQTRRDFLIKSASSLTIPVSLLWGKQDSVFPLPIAYQAQQVLHTPPPIVFEHSGHFLYLEEPDHFNSVLQAFAIEVQAKEGVKANEKKPHH